MQIVYKIYTMDKSWKTFIEYNPTKMNTYTALKKKQQL